LKHGHWMVNKVNKTFQLFVFFLVLAVSVYLGCATSSSSDSTVNTINVTGIVEVLHPGTRSETYIITDSNSGETFALVGDLVYEIVPEVSRQTAVIGKITEEGYSVREELRKLFVLDFSAIQEGDYTD